MASMTPALNEAPVPEPSTASRPRVVAIVQARMGSTRFPGKVLREAGGSPIIAVVLKRLSQSALLDEIVVVTPETSADRTLTEYVETLGYRTYQGSETDVLDRYYQAAKLCQAEVIVRVTGDCPLIDAGLLDEVVTRFFASGVDYATNNHPPTYPDGLDSEVFTFSALERAWREASKPHDREHVTPYLKDSGLFRTINVASEEDFSDARWTVDEPEDLAVIEGVLGHFAPRLDFSWREGVALGMAHPELFQSNRHMIRNSGAEMGTGPKLWNRAKKVIPGGNMLLSKRAEMFLPNRWPAYFSRSRGCRVWDLDGNEFVDMSIMGIGTNTLGYGHPKVDVAVAAVIRDGNMSTFNCPEEVYLAEKLVALHPWADMVRFARTGGEANAIGVRIGRAAAGRHKVAICGYHGWHDWYLAANLGNDNHLSQHLLPGLKARGVPPSLENTTFPFTYNRFDELEAIVRGHDIGVIVMEVQRNMAPREDFLGKVRKLATDRGIVLMFDECTSGFRQTLGGLHSIYGVEPDLAMFGKALGNGYAINALIGRREVMESAQDTFISSTFWTERIGPAAALSTLDVMETTRSYEQITATGREISKRWGDLALRHRLPLSVSGLPALTSFSLDVPDMPAFKTLITQEMLKKGFLAGTSVYVCTEHKAEELDRYFDALDPVFALIGECVNGRPVSELLEGPVCESGFRRLN